MIIKITGFDRNTLAVYLWKLSKIATYNQATSFCITTLKHFTNSFISRKEADLDFYFDNEETEALKLDFYKDINNESKLVKYLDNLLKKNDKEKFD